MKRRMHFVHRAINLMVGFGLLFGGIVGMGYIIAIDGKTVWQIVLAAAAIVLGAAWIYDNLLDPMDDRYPEPEHQEPMF